MAPRRPRLLKFTAADPAEVVAIVSELRARRNGWVNFRPYLPELDGELDDDGGGEYERPKGSAIGIGGMLLKPAPPMPECSWVPGDVHRRNGMLPDSLGLAHPSGRRAGPQLVEAGMSLPTGWRVAADNARRGLVIELRGDYDVGEAVDWLVRAARVLTPFDLPPEWVAEVHTR